MLPFVVLTMDIGELLSDIHLVNVYLADPGATGQFKVYTVPKKKRKTLLGHRTYKATGGGTLTTDIMEVVTPYPVASVLIDSWAASDDSNFTRFDPAFIMKEDWWLRVRVAAYTAGDVLGVDLYYLDEDAY